MCLNTYLIYCLISCVIFISSIPFIYRERTKANIEEKSKGTDRSGRKRTRAAPRRSAILPAASPSSSSSPPSGGEDGKAKEQRELEEREPVRRMPPPSLPVPIFCLLPSPSTPSPVLPFRLRLRFLLFFALISSARSHLFALLSSCSSFLALLPAD